MKFRKTIEKDLPHIKNIFNQAIAGLKAAQIDQWQNGYPNIDAVRQDMTQNESYVLLKDDQVAATAMIAFGGEAAYDQIFDGKWLSSGKYAVIHRIAVADTFKGQGLAGEIIKKTETLCLEQQIPSIRIDTHPENAAMQRMLLKSGFVHCGAILLPDGAEAGSKRLTYEKLL